MARRTKYDPDTFPMKAKNWAEKGLTEAQIAHNLGVSVATFESYKKRYPQFLKSLKEGKKPLIIEIENALYKRAKGLKVTETTTTTMPDGSTKVEVREKEIPPDSTSCIYALNNIAEGWSNQQKIEHSGGVDVKLEIIDASEDDE